MHRWRLIYFQIPKWFNIVKMCELVNIALHLFLHNHGNIATEWLQGFFTVHSAIGSTVHSMPLNSSEHCTVHNHDGKYPAWPGFESGTSSLRVPVDTNEPSKPATL